MVTVRELKPPEIQTALCLVWRVFEEYESPDYTPEGTEEFYKTIHEPSFLSSLRWYGAFLQEKLVGVIATRSEGTHITLFFVDGAYHRQGIAKMLLQTVQEQCQPATMTVNSSPYAVPVYHKLGFRDTDTEQVVNGLRFTPMERKRQ